MLDDTDILQDLREELAATISRRPVAAPKPLPISPWLAKALLQKSARRGETEWALRAAATLLFSAPDALWRRLGSIAFEDVGLADIDAVIATTVALAGKRYRATLGGEWQVASHLVSVLVGAKKCRATDDLLLAAENHPAYAAARRDLPELDIDQLLSSAFDLSLPLPTRALALWFATGTDRRPSPRLSRYVGNPNRVFLALFEAGVPPTLVTIAREGFKAVGEVLCPFLPLLSLSGEWKGATVADDLMPPESLVGGLPGWAIDLYSREGRRALSGFAASNAPTAIWVRENVPTGNRIELLGTALFRVEGGLMRQRLQWRDGTDMRDQVDRRCFPEMEDATWLLKSMRNDLPILQEVRANVLG